MQGQPDFQYRVDIDGLRAIAVLAVVAFHAAPIRISGGFVGVDVFFVISGFLISSIIMNGLMLNKFSFIDFYLKRIRRIFPALILILLACWILGYFILEPASYAMLGKHIVTGALFVSNVNLYSESGYFDPIARLKPLLHLWSLGVEEQFYFVLPIFLVAVSKSKQKLYVWILILLSVSFLINIFGINRYPVATFYLPFSRFWELLIGVLLAFVNINHYKSLNLYYSIVIFKLQGMLVSLRDVASLFGLLLFVVGIFLFDESISFPGWRALLPTLGAMLLISAGPSGFVNRTLLSHRGMSFIGLISYPLYLWHWPLLSFARMTSINSDYPKLTTITMLVLAFALSCITYFYVEKPLRFNSKLQSKPPVQLLFGALSALAIVGLITAQNGLSIRYPEAARALIDFKFDYMPGFRNDKCLLYGTQRNFSTECAGTGMDAPLMLIWGDSHGAMLYSALNEVAQIQSMAVAQYTSSSCPPILNFEKNHRPLCKVINDDIFLKIKELRPTSVVLASDWPQSASENSLEKLPETVKSLRQIGVSKIILVGPVPHWDKPLSVVASRLMRDIKSNIVPDRMISNVSIETLDENMAQLARRLSIEYVSSYSTFCNLKGCLVYVVDAAGIKVLTAFDDAHLMPAAAEFLVSKNKTQFFEKDQ